MVNNENKSYWEQQTIFWKEKFYNRTDTEIGIIYGQAFNLAHAELLETYGNEKDIMNNIAKKADLYFELLMNKRKQAIKKYSEKDEEEPEFETADSLVMPEL